MGITSSTGRKMTTQILDLSDVAKGDWDGGIVRITNLDGIINGLVEKEDQVLMGRDSEQACTQTVTGNLRKVKKDKEKKMIQTHKLQITQATMSP